MAVATERRRCPGSGFTPSSSRTPTACRRRGREVRAIVERSLQRLRQERLDLVQLHWWRYEVEGAVETAGWLKELQDEGLIELIGATNFDTTHLGSILESGVAGEEPAGAVLPARSAAGERHAGASGPAWRAPPGLWRAGRWPAHRRLAGPAGAGHGRPRQPLPRQVQAHHRRFRRLGPLPGAARRLPPDRPTGTASR